MGANACTALPLRHHYGGTLRSKRVACPCILREVFPTARNSSVGMMVHSKYPADGMAGRIAESRIESDN
eukprot:509170-Amphidinium_carterae.1